MDIEFSCSKCGQKLVVDEKHAGTSVDCPKCQANLPVPYKFQCSACSFKSYGDFSRCPKCRGVGPGPLGDKVRKKRKWMRRLSFAPIALVLAYFLLIFAVNQVVRAKKVRIEKKLAIAKELIVKGKDLKAWKKLEEIQDNQCLSVIQGTYYLKAWEELEEIQATAHKLRFKEEEIKQIMKTLGPEVEEIRRQQRSAEEKRKAKVRSEKKAERLKKLKTTISGGAWVTKGGGQSDILRGLDIALLEPNKEMTSKIIALRKESREKYPNTRYTALGSDISEISTIVAPHVIKLVKTNIDGKYKIKDVQGGQYLLYSYYMTSFSVAYWLIPVKIESNEPIEIDFENSNMTELYNKE